MSRRPHGQATDTWPATLDPTASEAGHDDAPAALDAVREEPLTRLD